MTDRIDSENGKFQLYLLCGLAILLPLVFSPLPWMPVELPRLTLILTVVTVLLASFAYRLGTTESRIKFIPIMWALLFFLGWSLLADLFSVHIPSSVFGSYNRLDGFLLLLVYLGLFFFTTQIKWQVAEVRLIFGYVVGGALLVSAYGLLQFFGIDFVSKSTVFEAGRSYATFGNPSLLVGFLVMVLPPALGSALLAGKPVSKFFYASAAVAIAVTVLTTFTRGGWLGALVSLGAFVYLAWPELRSQRRLVYGFTAVLIGALLAVVLVSGFIPNAVNFGQRAKSVVAVSQGSVGERLQIWKSAAVAIGKKPILGYGQGTFRLVFPQYETLLYARSSGRRWVADNPHNFWLDIAFSQGIPAAVVFLTVVVSFVIRGVSLARGPDSESVFWAAVVSGGLGYLVSASFTLNPIGGAVLLWFFFGLVFSRDKGREYLISPGRGLTAVLSLLTSVIIVGVALLAVVPYVSYGYFLAGNASLKKGDYVRATAQYRRAINLNPYNDEYYWESGRNLLNETRRTGKYAYFRQSVSFFSAGARMNPKQVDYYAFLGDAYYYAGRYDSAYYRLAVRYWGRAAALRPRSGVIHLMLAKSYQKIGEEKRAKSAYRQALFYDPELK